MAARNLRTIDFLEFSPSVNNKVSYHMIASCESES